MKCLVVTSTGNGYYCHCCRHESVEFCVMEFDSDEAAVQYARDVDAAKQAGKKTGTNDKRIDGIYELARECPIV